jgi:hypothetical protein
MCSLGFWVFWLITRQPTSKRDAVRFAAPVPVPAPSVYELITPFYLLSDPAHFGFRELAETFYPAMTTTTLSHATSRRARSSVGTVLSPMNLLHSSCCVFLVFMPLKGHSLSNQ